MINKSDLKGKRILITGGTGSFGQAFAAKLLKTSACSKVIIFSRDEWKQWEMANTNPLFSDPRVRFFLGDIRDPSRLKRAFTDVDIVVHAAALKQVPAAEYNPSEFVNTNVMGAINIINAAIDCGVRTVLALSTDKAVNPVNLYGATKLCADKLFIAGNAYVGGRGFPVFSVVRYGNVLGSRGSIITYWQKMLADGAKEIPVTDARMTRFWITLEQSVDFVVQSMALARGGEIFVPKIPSMKLVDLAEAVAPGVKQKIIGIREGEKINEILVSGEESRHTLEFDNHYMIVPEIFINRPELLEKFLAGRKGKSLPPNFVYSSDTNPQWLKVAELKKLLKGH